MASNQNPGQRGASTFRDQPAAGGSTDPLETMDGDGPSGFTAGQQAGAHEGFEQSSSTVLRDTGGTQDWASDFRQDEYEQHAGDFDGDSEGGAMDQAREKAGAVAGKAQEKAGEIKDRALSMTGDPAERVDQATDKVGEAAQTAAEKLRQQAGGSGPQAQVAEKLAGGMEQAGSYLQEHDATEMWDDIEHWVREHPTQALFGAVAAGFVLGRAMR